MPSEPHAGEGRRPIPSMLDLVRMSSGLRFPPGGQDLYRHIGLLTEMADGDEVLDVACGPGVSLEYFVREYGVQGSGVDYDPVMVERAEDRIREAGLSDRLQFQHGSLDELPYRDEIFDVVVGEMGLTAHADPEAALGELVRVAKPGGTVVLIQLVWKAPVDEHRREVLSRHLGARPLMLVELKRILREKGVQHLHTEDWSDEETAFRRRVTKPFPDFAELFSLTEKLGILRRAWKRWGWVGVKTALLREREVHRLLTRERIIGLDLLMGTKAREAGREETGTRPDEEAVVQGELGDEADAGADEEATEAPERTDEEAEEPAPDDEAEEQTVGLPLFASEGERE